MTAQKLLNQALGLLPWSVRRHIKRIPGIAQLQRLIVSRMLDGKEFAHRVEAGPARGITFQVRMPEDKGIWTGTYEQMFASRLAAAVRAGSVAYDIGSWHGFFAGVMAAQGASVVHVFEPLPANADRIRQLIALNPERNIALHACALGDRDTELDLMVMPETSMAKLEHSKFQAGLPSTSRVRVSVRSVDSMVGSGEIPPPGLMKIDVEGAELMVLQGAAETLRRHHPRIFAEIHSSELLAQCTSLLRSDGYSIESLDEDPDAARARDVFQIHATTA
jgi:FkbM family methyltransferase